MDHHQDLAVRLVEMIMVIEMKVFGKTNVYVSCIRSMSRLFYILPINFFYFPNPNTIMLTVKIMRSSSLSCAALICCTAHAFT